MSIKVKSARRFFGQVLALFLVAPSAPGRIISLTPSADTSLIETAPTNNMGGSAFFNAGSNLATNRNRGLLKFNLASQIPAGSRIRTVTLSLNVVHQGIDMPSLAVFHLHRMLRDWGEGNKSNSNSPGQGFPATPGEATWMTPFALTTNSWSQPGGRANSDFATAVSAEQEIRDPNGSPFSFLSTTALVTDVQSWSDDPRSNFGWMLLPADETIPATAKRFASREDTNYPPVLTIDFVPPPRLSISQIINQRLQFSFAAEANQSYLVQFQNSLSPANSWLTLTNLPASNAATNAAISDPAGNLQRFYRVIAP